MDVPHPAVRRDGDDLGAGEIDRAIRTAVNCAPLDEGPRRPAFEFAVLVGQPGSREGPQPGQARADAHARAAQRIDDRDLFDRAKKAAREERHGAVGDGDLEAAGWHDGRAGLLRQFGVLPQAVHIRKLVGNVQIVRAVRRRQPHDRLAQVGERADAVDQQARTAEQRRKRLGRADIRDERGGTGGQRLR